MRALVTGATGKVGHSVALALLDRGDQVRALVRDPERAQRLLPPDVEFIAGDVTELSSILKACSGCEVVFNAMGLPEQWLRDQSAFTRVNALGTEAVVRAAGRSSVRRVVHTSSIDVFDGEPGRSFDESRVSATPKGTAYERSKQDAERLALAAANDSDIELVIVNPAAVYGPGPGGEASSFEEGMFRPIVLRQRLKLPMLPPGGTGIVFAPALARGQLLAADRGTPGERYILCDTHVDFPELAEAVVRLAGRGAVPPTMPVWLARALAAGGEGISRLIRRPPLLPSGQLHFFLWNPWPDAAKARKELGWEPTPLEQGLRATLEDLDLQPKL
jgi:nucleoside-diphosphate-sugar epimerase